jgi:hypothetical protein
MNLGIKSLLAAALALMVSSCAAPPETPRAQETSSVKVITAGAGVKRSGGTYYYHVGLSAKQGVSLPIYAVAEFENPAHPAKPLISEGSITENGNMLRLESSNFSKRPENRIHNVVVRFYRDASKRQKIDELRQSFLPALPSEQEMRRAGLGHLVD